MLTNPNLMLVHSYGVPHHIMGHNNATTPVAMYFRCTFGPLEAIDVIQCDKANQLVCVCLVECSLAPSFCSDMLMVCHTTYRAITMPQHPLACTLDLKSRHKIGPMRQSQPTSGHLLG